MKFLNHIIVFTVGILVGATGFYFYIHSKETRTNNLDISYQDIIGLSVQPIREDGFRCDGPRLGSVGEVIGSILEFNASSAINRMEINCNGQSCWLGVSDCKPWESNECGARILGFDIRKSKEIDPTSFRCVDIP